MATWTLNDLAVLEKAIASGANRVKFEDREVEYRSITELLRARTIVRRALGLEGVNDRRSRAVLDKELSGPTGESGFPTFSDS